MLKAERQCRKLRMGEIPFAPTTVQCYSKEWRLWSLYIKKLSGRRVSARLIKRMAKRYKIQYPLLQPLKEAQLLRSKAIKKYKAAKPFAKQLRQKFLTDKIKDCEALDDNRKANIVTSISKKRKSKRTIRTSN